MEKIYQLTVNGLAVPAVFDTDDVENIFLPLLQKWTRLQRKLGRRIFLFMAAPPGTGKSTLSLFLEFLSRSAPDITPLQAVGMDGFHHTHAYLNTHFISGTQTPLISIKGAPESFDAAKLRKALVLSRSGDPMWPIYDRQSHDIREEQIQLREQIILLEGNYLLLKEAPWDSLMDFCDDSVFLSATAQELEGRLVERKIAGGSSPENAKAHVHTIDFPNIQRVLEHSRKANLTLKLEQNRFLPIN